MNIVPPKLGIGKGFTSCQGLNFIDFSQPIARTMGTMLPHWDQCGKIQYVTCRLNDSLPFSKLEALEDERELIASGDHLIKIDNVDVYLKKIDYYLAQGYGECLLKYGEIQRIVDDALHFYDGKRYDLFSYVIMPNHMHFLVMPYENIKKIWDDFRRFTTREINKLLGRTGCIWQNECFDRMVRSAVDMNRIIEYIKFNPEAIHWQDSHNCH